MTEKDLINAGYSPAMCRIGILYFNMQKGFHCMLKDDGKADFRSNLNDMKSLGIASTIEELNQLEKQYYLDKAKEYSILADLYIDKANEIK